MKNNFKKEIVRREQVPSELCMTSPLIKAQEIQLIFYVCFPWRRTNILYGLTAIG